MAPHHGGDVLEWRVVAPHREHAVGDDDGALAVAGRLSQGLVEVVEVEMPVDRLGLRPRQTHRIDDAVVVQRIGDDDGLRRDHRYQHAESGGVGRAEDHAGFATMEGRQGSLELHVRSVSPTDEANRSGTDAKRGGGLFLCCHQLADRATGRGSCWSSS